MSGAPTVQPPADDNGLAYDTDLLTLAAGVNTCQDSDDADRPAPRVAPDPELQAELDGFAALLTHDSSTDLPTVTTDHEESQ